MFGFEKIIKNDFDISRWNEAEKFLGSEIPKQCKDVVNFFGEGEFDDFLILFSPRDACLDVWGEEYREVKEFLDRMNENNFKNGDSPSPFKIGPGEEELLLLAETSNGDYVFSENKNGNVVLWMGRNPNEGWQQTNNDFFTFMKNFMVNPLSLVFSPSDAKHDGEHFFRPFDQKIVKQTAT